MTEISDTVSNQLLAPFSTLLSDMQTIHSVLENVDYSKYLQFEPVTINNFVEALKYVCSDTHAEWGVYIKQRDPPWTDAIDDLRASGFH